MSDLTPAPPNLSNHCECAHPMTVLVDDEGLYRDGQHDADRETWQGLAAALDGHHRALLCGKCDGTESFDVEYHQSMGPWGK